MEDRQIDVPMDQWTHPLLELLFLRHQEAELYCHYLYQFEKTDLISQGLFIDSTEPILNTFVIPISFCLSLHNVTCVSAPDFWILLYTPSASLLMPWVHSYNELKGSPFFSCCAIQ